jgi:hypothetical protein
MLDRWTTIVSYAITFVAGVLTKVLADWWTDRLRGRQDRSAADEQFQRIEAAMPALLDEIKK